MRCAWTAIARRQLLNAGGGLTVALASGYSGSVCSRDLTDVGRSSIGPPLVPAGPVTLRPGESIQRAVNASPAGTVFVLTPGTYLNQRIVPKKGNVFYGQPGAVLDGTNTTSTAFDVGGAPYPDS